MGTSELFSVGEKRITAEDTAALVLGEVMTELKRQFPNETEFRAVVTVPMRFQTNAPRTQTVEALKKAGFTYSAEHCILDEPVGAAVALGSVVRDCGTVLVADFGGGTFDLSLLRSSNGAKADSAHISPIAWDGSRRLGGNDIDNVLLKLISQAIKNDGQDDDISKDPSGVMSSQREICGSLKVRSYLEAYKDHLYRLSDDDESIPIVINDVFGDDDYMLDFELTLGEYKKAVKSYILDAGNCEPKTIFEEMRDCISNIAAKAGGTVDKVIAAGGMAHEPVMPEILGEMFGENNIIIPEDTVHLVAQGAAVDNSDADLELEARAYSNVAVLIKNNTDVDVIIEECRDLTHGLTETREYYPFSDNATSVIMRVVEYSGKPIISMLKPVFVKEIPLRKRLLRKKQVLNVQFDMNRDNILNVSVRQKDGTLSCFDIKF